MQYLDPPTIISSPSGTVESQLGNIFEIVCETRGIPSPAISWRHNGKNKTNTYENNRRLLVEIKDYSVAGPIECIANNGVGDSAIAGIVLVVLCKYLNTFIKFFNLNINS